MAPFASSAQRSFPLPADGAIQNGHAKVPQSRLADMPPAAAVDMAAEQAAPVGAVTTPR